MLFAELPYGEAIPLLHIYPREMKTYLPKSCMQMFIAAFFMILEIQKHPKFQSIDEWINKTQYSHTMGNYPAIQKE